jgi:hypothetical protein
MKFIAVPTLVMSSLLVGAVGGAAMTIALQTAGYMRVEENESGMMTVQFDANKNWGPSDGALGTGFTFFVQPQRCRHAIQVAQGALQRHGRVP